MGIDDQSGNADFAADAAFSISAAPERGTRAISVPIDGFITGNVESADPSCHVPAMKFCTVTDPFEDRSPLMTLVGELDVLAISSFLKCRTYFEKKGIRTILNW